MDVEHFFQQALKAELQQKRQQTCSGDTTNARQPMRSIRLKAAIGQL